jgi:hypothetical protein
MLLSDRLWFLNKSIIALSAGHFEYFFTLSENIYTCLRASITNANVILILTIGSTTPHPSPLPFEGRGRG